MKTTLVFNIFFIFGVCHLNEQQGISCFNKLAFISHTEKLSSSEFIPNCPVNEDHQNQGEHCCHNVHTIAFLNEPGMKIPSENLIKISTNTTIVFYLDQVPTVPTGPPKLTS